MLLQFMVWFLALFGRGLCANDAIPDSQENNQWFRAGVDLIKSNLKVRENRNTAKNAIVFLGDGMGPSTVTAARILDGQLRGESGEENFLSFEKFPWSALCKTYNVDEQNADSAASATAFLTGVKTRTEVIGVDERVIRGYCKTMTEASNMISILTLAEEAGMSTGIVTTARITHATPAVLYAHSADSDWESDYHKRKYQKDDATACKDIALQLVEYSHGDGIEVLFGGGRRNFIPNSDTDPEHVDRNGSREDGRNLLNEWLARNNESEFLWNKTAFDALDVNRVKHVMGLFEWSHMNYEVERANDTAGEPSITEMTEKAIQILSKNPKGYFLLVEGGRIDHGHHQNQAVKALTEAVTMAQAVTKATKMTSREDTLIITTADHSHAFTFAGYPKRGNPIFGVVVDIHNITTLGNKDNLPYTTLGYANGPGAVSGVRQNLTGVNTADKDYRSQALVYRPRDTHGGEDVGIYADGPGAYLIHGVVEQNYIFHVLDYALCLGDSKQELCAKHVARGGRTAATDDSSSLTPVLFIVLSYLVLAALGM